MDSKQEKLLKRARDLLQIFIARRDTGFETATKKLVSEITAELGDEPNPVHHMGAADIVLESPAISDDAGSSVRNPFEDGPWAIDRP